MIYMDPQRAMQAIERQISQAQEIKTGDSLLNFAQAVRGISSDATFGSYGLHRDPETRKQLVRTIEDAIKTIDSLFTSVALPSAQSCETIQEYRKEMSGYCQELQDLIANPNP